MKREKILSILLAFLLCFSVVAPGLTAWADSDTISINSASDLVALSKKCQKDTWSQGKTVILEKDIDLSKSDFTSIPTFGGTFEGNGHMISGFSLSKNGSNQGLFRYLQASGVVSKLTVKGTVKVGGSKNSVGGIVGNNSGTLSNCHFVGNVKGTSYVGGVVGVNQGSGRVTNCRMDGVVYGEHYVGGVIGENLGTAIYCTNSASVNTTTETVKLNKEDLNLDKINSTTNTDKITDIGGVCGFSSGIVQSCTNKGIVGYEHVGYNVGGVVGRQSGYLSGCTNSGDVYGRKDVGGVVGQMEPHTKLQYSSTSLASISGELDTLQSLIDQAMGDAEATQSSISGNLSSTQDYVDGAKDAVNTLADKTTDLVNSDMDSVNDMSARIAQTLDDLSNTMDTMDGTSDKITEALDGYQKAMDSISDAVDSTDTANLKNALDKMSDAISYLDKSLTQIRKSMDYLEQGLGNLTDTQEAFQKLGDGINMLSQAMDKIKDATSDVKDALAAVKAAISSDTMISKDQIDACINTISTSLDTISACVTNMGKGAKEISNALKDLAEIGNNAVYDMIDAVDALDGAIGNFQSAMSAMNDAIDDMQKSWDDLENVADKTKDALKQMSNATGTLKDGVNLLSNGLDGIRDTLKRLADEPTITFQKVDDDYIKTKDQVSDSFTNISDSLRQLNSTVSSSSTTLINDMKAISNQLFKIFDLMIDSTDEIKDKSTDPKDYTEDVSDEDTAGQTDGKVKGSENHAMVTGDVNTGGITGSMAIEYDFDPEDDVTKEGDSSLNFVYKTRAVLRDCTNYGEIEGKKDYVGGIVGKMDLGSTVNCLGLGSVTSKSGDYVGGVAGGSESTIQKCYAKCALSGDDYIGGIAGEAKTLKNCVSIVRVDEGDECVGAIAGSVTGAYISNYYVTNDLGAIDGIDYATRAEGTTYEDLMTIPGLPDAFHTFTLTFIADGQLVDKVNFEYGASLEANQIPKVPQKNGRFGKWKKTNFNNLTADETIKATYGKYVTAIESSNHRKNGLAIVVAEGKFASTSVLTLNKSDQNAPNLKFYEKELERWDAQMTEDDSEENTIHYLLPNGEKHVNVMVLKNGKWKLVHFDKDGQYILFKVDKDTVTFSVIRTNRIATRALFAALIACALVLLTLLWISILSRRKNWAINQKRLSITAILILLIAAVCGMILFM